MSTTSEVAPLAECGLATWGVVRIPTTDIAALRKNPGKYQGGTNPASALKLVDEQTVVAVASVLRAVGNAGWEQRTFHDWGVIAAPQFLGRVRSAVAQVRFAQQYVRGVSPLLVPHLSMHATAASISIAMAMRGMSFGVGGSPGQIRDALLTGLGLVLSGEIPGLWVVLTQWVPEPVPDMSGNCATPSECVGLAMALVDSSVESTQTRLRLRPAAVADSVNPPADAVDLAAHLAMAAGSTTSWFCRLAAGLSVEFSRRDNAQSGSLTDSRPVSELRVKS